MKITAASCSKLQDVSPQPVWEEIRAEKPDVLLLLGDNVYLDHDHHDDPQELAMELRMRYERQFGDTHFAALLRDLKDRGKPVIAVYDDHDFLGNNRYGGDDSHALRVAARQEFRRAFGMTATDEDIYRSMQIDDVEIVVLDERFYRRSPGSSFLDRDAILGQNQ